MGQKREKKAKVPRKNEGVEAVKTVGKYVFLGFSAYALFMLLHFAGPTMKIKWEDFRSDVLVLNENNFDATIAANEEVMVEFYAPWCGHCQRLKPEYDIAAKQLKYNSPPIYIAKVDCIVNKDLCKKYDITGYPTLKIFTADGESSKYDGPLKAEGIVSKMLHEANSEPLPEEQGDLKYIVQKNFNELVLESDADVFVKFYAPWCGHCKSMAPAWEELATKYKDDSSIIIGHFDATANDLLLDQYKELVKGYPSLLWIPKGDKQNPVKYSGARDIAAWEKWISQNSSTIKSEL